MPRISFIVISLLFLPLLFSLDAVEGSEAPQALKTILKEQLLNAAPTFQGSAVYQTYSNPFLLNCFYSHRDFEPAWCSRDGLLPQAESFFVTLENADSDGLSPEAYHLAALSALRARIAYFDRADCLPDPHTLAMLDLLLTDSFLRFAGDLSAGRVKACHPRLTNSSRRQILDNFVSSQTIIDQTRIEEIFKRLQPQGFRYSALKSALLAYRKLAATGGWPALPPGRPLKRGDTSPRVIALKERLFCEGDLLKKTVEIDDTFDNVLEQAVRSFQGRHGLKADGVVGPATLAEMNIPIHTRIRQIELNLERWRRLPSDLGHRYIMVNAACFELYVVEDDQVVFTIPVAVGMKSRPTPVFSGEMTYLELNPYWHIPKSIAKRDILPRIWNSPSYLTNSKIKVFEDLNGKTRELDPQDINWQEVTKKTFAFRLRQDPGPSNALGRIKFVFPNKYAVYIHDTPAQRIFQKTNRSLSSGCIRVARPVDLAEYLLDDDSKWCREKILKILEKGRRKVVPLAEPIPVHIFYYTAWVDKDGRTQFRKDIYGRDKRLDLALRKKEQLYTKYSGLKRRANWENP
jgi:murein L,D-transpeptidase YcbB/YkuD